MDAARRGRSLIKKPAVHTPLQSGDRPLHPVFAFRAM